MKGIDPSFKKISYLLVCYLFLAAFNSCKNGNDRPLPENSGDTLPGNKDSLFAKYHLDKIKLPEDFSIEVYAEVPNARSLCVSSEGTVFVGTHRKEVYAITDHNQDGKADKIYKVASGLDVPNGVAFRDGNLYIGATSNLYRIDQIESHLDNPPKPVVVYDQYPSDSHHGARYIAFGPDGKLYLSVGAPCNTCVLSNPMYATITRINKDGTGMEIFAKGIRNTVGFDWNPVTNQIWFTDNGRDGLGDDIPNDELNMAPQSGMDFGYPWCHQGDIPDPDLGKGKDCSDYTAPTVLLGAHVASLGMRFNTSNIFPPVYKNAIFIAEHGSWNRSVPVGYRIAAVKMNESGQPSSPEIFADGWLQNEKEILGRPVDVQVLKDGTMLVSDDFNGVIYRIHYAPDH